MGMAASQARLIQLNERMNDIEFQGQQINQQRTTLSNQSNAKYSALLDMEVPTPPSTLDFKKTVYTGADGVTKFTLNNIIPTGKEDGVGKYSIDIAYQLSGNSFQKESSTASLSEASEFLYYKEANISSYMYESTVREYTEPATQLDKDQISVLATTDASADPTANDILVKMTVAEYNTLIKGSSLANSQCYSKQTSGALREADDLGTNKNSDVVYVRINAGDLKNNSALAKHCGLTYTEVPVLDGEGNPTGDVNTEVSGTAQNVYSPEELGKGKDEKVYENYKSDALIENANLYVLQEGAAVPIKSLAELKDYIEKGNCKIYKPVASKDTEGAVPIKNPNFNSESTTGLQVGNMPVHFLSDLKNEIGEATYVEYLNGLRHTFPEFAQLDDDELAGKFYAYKEPGVNGGREKLHIIPMNEVGSIDTGSRSVRTYEYDAAGTYVQNTPTQGCELKFDANGRILEVGIPDGKGQILFIPVTYTTETDDEAYEDAMNEYNYKKACYDKEQQDINNQISIIQQQDKNLELKLTRLDNERNAVKTEIDAVKKVVDENIEKSFKTFSG